MDELSEEDLDALLTQDSESDKVEASELANLVGNSGENKILKDQSGVGLDPNSLEALVGSLDPISPVDEALENADLTSLSDASSSAPSGEKNTGSIDFLHDVKVRFTVELGRTKMLVRDVLKLKEGALIALDRNDGDEVNILVNDHLFARGRLKTVDGYYAVQIVKILDNMSQYRIQAS